MYQEKSRRLKYATVNNMRVIHQGSEIKSEGEGTTLSSLGILAGDYLNIVIEDDYAKSTKALLSKTSSSTKIILPKSQSINFIENGGMRSPVRKRVNTPRRAELDI